MDKAVVIFSIQFSGAVCPGWLQHRTRRKAVIYWLCKNAQTRNKMYIKHVFVHLNSTTIAAYVTC